MVHTLLDPHDTTEPDPATAPAPPARLPGATLDITNATGRDGLEGLYYRASSHAGHGSRRPRAVPRQAEDRPHPHTHQQRVL